MSIVKLDMSVPKHKERYQGHALHVGHICSYRNHKFTTVNAIFMAFYRYACAKTQRYQGHVLHVGQICSHKNNKFTAVNGMFWHFIDVSVLKQKGNRDMYYM